MQILNKILVALSLLICSIAAITINNSPALENIAFLQTSMELYIGDSASISFLSTPKNAAVYGQEWTSSNEEVATVSSNGWVSALSAGETVITLTSRGKSASCSVTVKPILVSEVSIQAKYSKLLVGEKMKLSSSISPTNATDKTISWTSSDGNIIAVDEEGNIEAKALGEAIITATAKNGISDSITFEVTDTIIANEIIINKTSLSLKRHETYNLFCSFVPQNSTNTEISWESSNENIASVSPNGKITALKQGSTTITGTSSNNLVVTCQVTVTEIKATSASIKDPTRLVGINVGYTTQLVCNRILPTNTTDTTADVVFKSNDSNVATITEKGFLTAVGSGDCEILIYIDNQLLGFANVLVI